jgi:hypothetical protein
VLWKLFLASIALEAFSYATLAMRAKFFLLERKEDLSQDGGERMALDDVEKLIHEAQKKRGSGAAMQRWFLEEIKKLLYAEMGESGKRADADGG